MTKPQIVLRRSLEERRQPLLQAQHSSTCSSNRFAEVAGGTTAECAAVCCCFPCAVVDFMVLAMYRVPAGLCRNALRRKRHRRLMMQGSGVGDSLRSRHRSSIDGSELSMHPAVAAAAERFMMKEADKDVIALENEMWEKFYGTGFWRSPSQRID